MTAVSPAINAGTLVTGLHDQATAATDYAGTTIKTIPDIGAYEYTDQTLWFDAAVAAGGNGTRGLPYHLLADYTLSGYSLRRDNTVYLKGALGALDMSSLTDTGTSGSYITITNWPSYTFNLSGFANVSGGYHTIYSDNRQRSTKWWGGRGF